MKPASKCLSWQEVNMPLMEQNLRETLGKAYPFFPENCFNNIVTVAYTLFVPAIFYKNNIVPIEVTYQTQLDMLNVFQQLHNREVSAPAYLTGARAQYIGNYNDLYVLINEKYNYEKTGKISDVFISLIGIDKEEIKIILEKNPLKFLEDTSNIVLAMIDAVSQEVNQRLSRGQEIFSKKNTATTFSQSPSALDVSTVKHQPK